MTGQCADAGYMRGAWKVSENKDAAELKDKFHGISRPNKQPFMDAVKPLQ